MRINIEKILAVRQVILDNPDQVDMDHWLCPRSKIKRALLGWKYGSERWHGAMMNNPANDCGTMGCIAGWTIALESTTKKLVYRTMAKEAAEILGISYSDSLELFYPQQWPVKFQHKYIEADNQLQKAQIVAERIDAFLLSRGYTVEEAQPSKKDKVSV